MIYVLPGMGATNAMFSDIWRELPETEFLDWPEDSKVKTIPALAKYLILKYNIGPKDSVMGTSLGGIVACEISNQVPIKHLVLIGSATNKTEINYLLQILAPAIELTPLRFIQTISGKLHSDLATMFAQSDATFIRDMCKAIFSWNGLSSEIKPFRIHGKKDLIIPPSEQADLLLEGGHLIAMTHARECVHAIRQFLDEAG